MKSGIYKIVCTVNGKIYVGSSKNMKSRFSVHLSDLKRGKHGNPYMKEIYEKHGKEVFNLVIIERCFPEFLKNREQYWIDKLNSCNPDIGFNVHRYSEHKKSIIDLWKDPEYKEKISQKHKDRWKDPEFAKRNLKGIRKHLEKQIEKFGCYAFQKKGAREKLNEYYKTEEFRNKKSLDAYKQLENEEYRLNNLEVLKRARKSTKRKENLKSFNEFQKNDSDHKKRQAQHAKNGWNDPIKREKRILAIKEALRKKREKVGE